MTERIRRLRAASLAARPCISDERARIVTDVYRDARGLSTPMLRAEVFRRLMAEKAVCVAEDELIVGERGPLPKATPTFPELCCHSRQDLEILHSRPKTSYDVPEEVRETYADEVIPFWRGRSMRERIFAAMAPEWLDAYEAGIFTEF